MRIKDMTLEERDIALARMREVQAARLLELEAIAHAAKVRAAIAEFAKLENAAKGRAIDSALAKANIRTEVAVTREVAASRITLHDYALKNPVLAKILREAQKVGTL